MLNLDDFYRARYVLSNVVRRTDLIYAPKINQESEIYLKPENLQVTGSFKLRGACYKISQLGDEEKAKGVGWEPTFVWYPAYTMTPTVRLWNCVMNSGTPSYILSTTRG